MGEDPIADELKNNRALMGWLSTTSDQVQNYLSRGVIIKERTEYANLLSGQKEYWLEAPPIIDLTNVAYDSTGLWDGSESELSTQYSGINDESVVLGTELGITVPKGLRIIYTGGLAYHAVNSVFNMAEIKTWTVDNWVKGSTSGAVGRVAAVSSLVLTIESYYGVFEKDETLIEYTDIDCTTAADPAITSTISSISKQSLAEKYPAIVGAVEAQIRFYWNHMTDFENVGSDKEGNTIRQTPKTSRKYPFIDEVLDLLEPYRKTY